MNPDLNKLQPYPFEKLAQLKSGIVPPADMSPITLAIGEPKHAPPAFVGETMVSHLAGLAQYPLTKGSAALRQAIADWLCSRYELASASLDAERHILPVNGTREALFAFAQCVIDRSQQPLVLMPNPFYQIYEGAALLAGAEPYFLNSSDDRNGLPDFTAVPDAVWQRCQLLYICSPGNPTGAVIDQQTLQDLINLAEQYDFIIVADECYAEIYFDAAPVGLLAAAADMGNTDYRRCVVFHSLSKRSNLPGLRSGFVAGDAAILQDFYRYRTYHGCAMPPFVQAASIAAWQDEQHVADNRACYRRKFSAVLDQLQPLLQVTQPDAGFYLWPRTPIDDTLFAQRLFSEYHVTVLPGSYLSRQAHGQNPGHQHIRMALVASEAECIEAARRIRALTESILTSAAPLTQA